MAWKIYTHFNRFKHVGEKKNRKKVVGRSSHYFPYDIISVAYIIWLIMGWLHPESAHTI